MLQVTCRSVNPWWWIFSGNYGTIDLSMKHQITKAIIPVAGYGTRFLPVTKAMPKEMLPILDKPVVQYIVEEAVASGIKEIILVTSEAKRPVEDHFDRDEELEHHLAKQGKKEFLKIVQQIPMLADFIYIRQKGPYGNGTPILNCRNIIGNEPFAVLWGDDVAVSEKPRLKQMMEVYDKYGGPVLAAIEVDEEGTKKYGIIDGKPVAKGIMEVKRVVEKPGPAKAPSRWASVGGYILTPDIFDILAKTPLGHGHELYLPDAIDRLCSKRKVYACQVEGKYYDAGSVGGWLKANIDFALERPDLKDEIRKYLKGKL